MEQIGNQKHHQDPQLPLKHNCALLFLNTEMQWHFIKENVFNITFVIRCLKNFCEFASIPRNKKGEYNLHSFCMPLQSFAVVCNFLRF